MTRSSRTLQCGVIVAFLLGLRVPAAQAQEFRGSITGTVSDKSAAVLPGVTVTGTNVDTGVGTTAITNADGGYLLPFLTPGSYSVTAELMGFKKLVRQGVAVRIGDRLTLDLALEVGAIAEVVSVTAESPLLDTLSASQGQVIDEKRIALLPLSDGNAFTLARLAPGVAYTGRSQVQPALRQRRDIRHRVRRRLGGQRVHPRRDAQHGQRAARRLRPASRRGVGVQGRDRVVRRPAGPHRGRHGERHDQERHQRPQGRGLLVLPRRQAVEERLLPRRRGSAQGGDELRPLRRLHRRADPEEPDVLLRRRRMALRRVPRARPVHGADREDAQR